MYTTVFDGIRFIEGHPPNANVIAPAKVDLGGALVSTQLKNLDDVKRLLAQQVRKSGGNALIEFKYGQKSVGFFASLFMRDDVNWYGSGLIATIP